MQPLHRLCKLDEFSSVATYGVTGVGEAIKATSPELLATGLSHPWSDIARMRDRLAHRYFDTTHSQVAGAVKRDLEPLTTAAVVRLQDRLPRGELARTAANGAGYA